MKWIDDLINSEHVSEQMKRNVLGVNYDNKIEELRKMDWLFCHNCGMLVDNKVVQPQVSEKPGFEFSNCISLTYRRVTQMFNGRPVIRYVQDGTVVRRWHFQYRKCFSCGQMYMYEIGKMHKYRSYYNCISCTIDQIMW